MRKEMWVQGARAERSPEIALPARFGRYTLLRKLAEGGMAEIYVALQHSVGGIERLVVIKRLLPNLASDESFARMFVSEARIVTALNHPNIAHVYEVGIESGHRYIAMEYVRGEDLRTIVRTMATQHVILPLAHAIAIALGCCRALTHTHEQMALDGDPLELVHRDISPQNLLVTYGGEVKLVDFGIATTGPVIERQRARREPTLRGKIPYMSPEQARGNTLDERSDIFSLGVILYELCTGTRLFRADTEAATLERILQEQYPDPRIHRPNLPDALCRILNRALAKDPNGRYQSAREMQTDLEVLVRDERMLLSPLALGEWMTSVFGNRSVEDSRMVRIGRRMARRLHANGRDESGIVSAIAEEPASPEAPPPHPLRTGSAWRGYVAPAILIALTGIISALATGLALEYWFRAHPVPSPPRVIGISEEAVTPDPAPPPQVDETPVAEDSPMTEEAPEAPPALGRLTITAATDCHVTVDGEAIGRTPIRDHELAVGPHEIVCVNYQLGFRRIASIEIRAGETNEQRM